MTVGGVCEMLRALNKWKANSKIAYPKEECFLRSDDGLGNLWKASCIKRWQFKKNVMPWESAANEIRHLRISLNTSKIAYPKEECFLRSDDTFGDCVWPACFKRWRFGSLWKASCLKRWRFKYEPTWPRRPFAILALDELLYELFPKRKPALRKAGF